MSKRSTPIRAALPSVFALLLLTPFFGPGSIDRRAKGTDRAYRAERAKLERYRAHARPGSVEGFKAENNLARLEAARAGRPDMDHPDLFAKILYQMKVKGGRVVPDYEPGYQVAELAKAEKTRTAKVPLPWQNRGPGNVAGRARGLLVDPDDPSRQTWWVGSVGGGIWKTTDAGATWIDVAPNLPNLPISWLVMADSDHDVMYAGTGESFFNVDTINGNGILKSIDHGQSWTPLASTLGDPDFNNISRIIVDPTDPDVIVASTTTGRYKDALNGESHIFKSVDGGLNWTSVYTETDVETTFPRTKRVTQVIATPGNFDVQYAAIDEKGILKSIDAGDTWALINNGLTDIVGRFELAISPQDTDRIWASAEDSTSSNLWVSNDAGGSWVQTFEVGSQVNWLGAQGWYDNTIVCDPDDFDRVYVGGIRLWQIDLVSPTDRVTSLLPTGSVHVDNHNLMTFDDPSAGSWRILNANDGGIGVSSFEATGWSDPDDGMITSQFYGVDKRPGASAYVGGMQDNGTWYSPLDPLPGDFWAFAIGGDGYEASWHFDDPDKIIGGYQFNGLQRSLDGGLSWNSATSGLADIGGGKAPFITKIAKSNLEPDLLFAVGISGVWRSTNFGGSWSLTPLFAPDWPDSTVSSFTDVRISRADPDVVWAGARMDADGRILVSTDRGLSFAATSNYPGMGGISGLATHPTDPNTAYVLFSFASAPKILKTTDLGATWTDITGFAGGAPSTNGFPDVAVYDLIVFPHDTDTIWVGTEIGLVESTDGGATWALANNGFPNIPIWFLTHVEDEVVAATHGRGIWSVAIPELVAGETYKPLLEKVVQGPDGLLTITVNLRSEYDQSEVRVDGNLLATLPANTARERKVITMPVTAAATLDVQVIAFRDGTPYASPVKSVDVVPLKDLRFTYSNDFNAFGDDFVTTGFSLSIAPGFSNAALQTSHNYPNGQTAIAMLTVPIAVATSNAILSFDEIVLVEPGDAGSVFGDFSFWDYVVVEATNDGCIWVPLADGYDAGEDPVWESAFNFGLSGTPAMLRNHQFDLLEAFSPGDNLLIRFRLYADGFVNGWGWLIDDLQIQTGGTAVDDTQPVRFSLAQNSPNPFNPKTEIQYSLPSASDVLLRIFDVRGRTVRTLVAESQRLGSHRVVWDGTDDLGHPVSSGVYLYRIEAGEFQQQRKMTLLK